ncbi:MAG: DUF1512 family protein [Candidatus Aenigmarchaeota archaeon]|nr:DUF1512 family protein [Candidatus Aenigmarchaeota archaeon]
MINYQLFQTDGGIVGNIIWFLLFFVMIFVYPRLMVTQMIWKLEQTANMLENFTHTARRIVTKKITKNPSKEMRDSINNFLEFFVIEPVSLDPYGIVKKIEHLVELSEKRFKYFVKSIAPKLDSENQANLMMGLSGAMSLNQITKIVKHYIGIIKKTKNLQLAMILQMQMPFIEKVSKALLKGTEALTNGWPIGDAAGAIAAAQLIGDSKTKEVDTDTVVSSKRIKGKTVYIIKAKGPGGRLGKIGKVVDRYARRQKVAKIITIDAAAKLEGEKTGSIAEGIGVAIGGVGVERAYIEGVATQKDIPLDTYIIKMANEEAIMPMKIEVLNAIPKVVKSVEDNISRTKEKGSIVIVGVGNTGGIGNSRKDADRVVDLIKKNSKILKTWEDEEKKREKKWFDLGF